MSLFSRIAQSRRPISIPTDEEILESFNKNLNNLITECKLFQETLVLIFLCRKHKLIGHNIDKLLWTNVILKQSHGNDLQIKYTALKSQFPSHLSLALLAMSRFEGLFNNNHKN